MNLMPHCKVLLKSVDLFHIFILHLPKLRPLALLRPSEDEFAKIPTRHSVAQLAEALHYKSEGRAFDSRSCHCNFTMTKWQQIRNTWKVLKCGAGEGWRRSVGSIMWEMKKCYFVSMSRRNILREIRKRKANWIGLILRRNCLLKQVIEGKIKREIEVTRRRGWRRKKLLDDLKDRRGYSHLKEEALDRTMWRNRFGGGFVPVVRQTTE